ncbi:MAG: translocation/assembly module TamB domain-containing protein [Salinibacter sp.]
MSSSPEPSSSPWRFVRWGLYLVLGAVVLFFALTRTDAGRDVVRHQLEAAFNERFAGSLHIQRVDGSLLQRVEASGITLRAPSGDTVLTMDSLRARPRWPALLGAELSIETLELVRPRLHLLRADDETWNVQRAFQRTTDQADGTSFGLSVGRFEVSDGAASTERDGSAPQAVRQNWLFDYTRSRLDQISGTGSIEWHPTSKTFSLRDASLRLPDQNLTLDTANGTLAETEDGWSVSPFRIALGDSDLKGRMSLHASDSTWGEPALDLAPSRLDNTELQRLSPRYPLRDTLRVEGQVSGTPDQFVLNTLRLTHGASSLEAEGTAYGLPEMADLDVQVSTSSLRPDDLAAVWPSGPTDWHRSAGPIQLSGALLGTVEWRDQPETTYDLESTLEAESPIGSVQGSLDVRQTPTEFQYDSRLRADRLNPAPFTGASVESQLTGQLELSGTGTSIGTAVASGRASLSSSQFRSAEIAEADLKLTADQGAIQAAGFALQPSGGVLSLRAGYTDTEPRPEYDLTASAEQLDLAAWSPQLPSSSLNATLTMEGQGRTESTATGRVAVSVDSSSLRRGDQDTSVPAHEITLDVSPPSADRPRIELGGTLATASIDGPVFTPAARSTGELWWTSLRNAIQEETRKPLDGSDPSMAPDSATVASLQAHADSVQNRPQAEAPHEINAQLAVHRMDVLRLWWPQLPPDADSLRSDLSLSLTANEMQASGTVSAGQIDFGTQSVRGLDGAYRVSASHDAPVNETVRASASLHADSMRVGRRQVRRPSVQFDLEDRVGQLDLNVDEYGTASPIRLSTRVDLQQSRNRVEISDITVGTAEGTWRLQSPGALSVYSDALRFDSLRIQNDESSTPNPQQIDVRGTFSSRSSDTLRVNADRVSLYSFSELLDVRPAVGGQVDGEMDVAGGWQRPQVQSTLRVHQLSLDRRVLGTLHFRSEFTSGRPDLGVEATLSPATLPVDSLSRPGFPPGGIRTTEPSQLSLSGRVRLPGLLGSETASPSDQLDVDVDVARADLFFFEYIFDDKVSQVRGFTDGSIHVGGSFRDPVFDAELRVEEGRFRMPEFGLAYDIEGPVDVDRDGIHLRSLTVSDDAGVATIDGSLLFNDYRYFSFDLSGDLDEITIIDVPTAADLPFYGTIRASGDATLTGPISDATLSSDNARTTPDSELFIPASQEGVETGTGFIVFADSTGEVPDLEESRRQNILSDRPEGEPTFTEGLDLDINVEAPEESTVHLVFDPVVGDVVTAEGSGRVQLQRQEGEFLVFGTFNVTEGTYQFTAGEVFVRRFNINEGTITWDGSPTNAELGIDAEYRTRASPAGLPGYGDYQGRIPVRLQLDISGRVATPQVDLSLSLVRDERGAQVGSQTLDAILNQPDRTTEYATSVLLTNTFLLTTESFGQGGAAGPGGGQGLSTAGNQLAFNSVSQLVASQLNRYLGAALPNVDLSFGLQGEDPGDLDIIYGVALRLLNERLVIRGEGVYTGNEPDSRESEGPQGEFVVEVRLTSRVSAEVFFRRAGDELTRGQTYTQSTGAGLSYQTEFPTWKILFRRVFGWLLPDSDEPPSSTEPEPDSAARQPSSGTAAPADRTESGSSSD